jgi:hypothetical protein
MDDVDALTITGNAKLATIAGSALKDNGAASVTTASVNISNNAFVASLVRDEAEAVELDDDEVGTSADKGTITSTSGLSTLDTYLAHAKAATGNVYAWFDTVTKYETQSSYGGAYTNSTSSLTAPSSYDGTEAAAAATKPYVYIYQRDLVSGTTTVTGKIDNEVRTNVYDVNWAANTLIENPLADNEGIIITGGSGTARTYKDGDAFLSAANSASVQTVDDLMNYLNADTALNSAEGIDVVAARDAGAKALYTVTYINSTLGNASLGVVSSVSDGTALMFQFGTTWAGTANYLTATLAANDTQDDIATAVMSAINLNGQWAASTTASTGSNSFYVTKNVSGTSTRDLSPLVGSFPSIDFVIDAAQTSTTAALVPSAYAVASNLAGKNSSLFTLADVEPDTRYGLRVSIKNVGNVAFNGTVSVTLAGVSETALSDGNTGDPDGEDNLLEGGTNILAYNATTNPNAALYVADFGDIAAGTSSTTGAVTAISTDRTTW